MTVNALAPASRLFRRHKPAVAHRLVVSDLMAKPAFAHLEGSGCSRVLAGQIDRGRDCSAADGSDEARASSARRPRAATGWRPGSRDDARSYEGRPTGDGRILYAGAGTLHPLPQIRMTAA